VRNESEYLESDTKVPPIGSGDCFAASIVLFKMENLFDRSGSATGS